MTQRRVFVAAGLLCAGLAVLVALLGRDVGRREASIRTGDVKAVAGRGDWSLDEALPAAPAKSLLGVGDDLDFRKAVALFRRARTATLSPLQPAGAGTLRLQAETALAHQVRTDSNRQRASVAANLLGILAFYDAAASTRGGDASADRAILELQRAVHLDKSNQLAKANLELVFQQHTAPYSVRGRERLQRSAHAGASASEPGSGY